MAYTSTTSTLAERHETQYFEMFCNRGIYHKGWSAVTKHRTPWKFGPLRAARFDDDVWELYDGTTDWTQAHDLAHAKPDKLHDLQRLFLIEAAALQRAPAGRPSGRADAARGRRAADAVPAPSRCCSRAWAA